MIAAAAASVPSEVMTSTRASTGRPGSSASSLARGAGAAGGAPTAGASGRIAGSLTIRGRTLRSRAIGNAALTSLDGDDGPHPAATASKVGKTRKAILVATRTRTKQPPCHRKSRSQRAECYRSGTRGNRSVSPRRERARCLPIPRAPPHFSGSRVRGEVVVSTAELGDLFKRYSSYVATIGMRLLGRDDEVDDLVQEVFIEAYRGFHQLRSPDAVKAWLARITVRRAIRRLRRRALRSFFSLDALPSDAKLADDGATPEEKAEIVSTTRMIERIPVRQRVVWVLK